MDCMKIRHRSSTSGVMGTWLTSEQAVEAVLVMSGSRRQGDLQASGMSSFDI
jgi:hypothetical protein